MSAPIRPIAGSQRPVFLINSRLGLLCDATINSILLKLTMATLLPKLRVHFAEFLNVNSLVRLRLLIPPTCVGFRYGLLGLLIGDCFPAP